MRTDQVHTVAEPTSPLDGWQSYPLRTARSSTDFDDLSWYHEQLEAKAGEIFIDETFRAKLEVLDDVGSQPCQADPTLISTTQQLAGALKKRNESRNTIYCISQLNSWSRLRITKNMFCMLCHTYDVLPQFLHIITAFGNKKASTDEHFIGCYGRYSGPNFQTLEICYNVRYFELHGRDLDDPWSCRQTAIYHKYPPNGNESMMMIIQAPQSFRTWLDHSRVDTRRTQTWKQEHPFSIHARYLTCCTVNMRKYLNHTSEELTTLDRKVTLPRKYKEYEVDFSLSQKIQTIRRKLSNVLAILETTIDTISTILQYSDALQEIASIDLNVHTAFRGHMQHITNDLRNHSRTVKKLLTFSDDIRLLNHKILSFLSNELILENGLSLSQLVWSDSTEKKVVVKLAEETGRDSRSMRVATTIALMYLPANLVFAFFSTNLIEFDQISRSLKIRTQVWIAVLITLALAVVTMIAARLWDRQGRSLRVM
ncbi:hypothetical protein K432DRAFT_427331 [Lepidopterella palustris CBS 459.81]|uniref:CorA-like transporter domain-containing protein n=1 Tax=Lepidopterella palustris CBS 459.81 TaxID=1314670 RepID=A0A8E2JDG8_9PEZI|nr:hypothetical protein K432DRAFT_427331 [Lepidopterella palustris CBS 459.81]